MCIPKWSDNGGRRTIHTASQFSLSPDGSIVCTCPSPYLSSWSNRPSVPYSNPSVFPEYVSPLPDRRFSSELSLPNNSSTASSSVTVSLPQQPLTLLSPAPPPPPPPQESTSFQKTEDVCISSIGQSRDRREKSRIAAKIRRDKENLALSELHVMLPIHMSNTPLSDSCSSTTGRAMSTCSMESRADDSTLQQQQRRHSYACGTFGRCPTSTSSAAMPRGGCRGSSQLSAAVMFEKAVIIRLASNSLCLYGHIYPLPVSRLIPGCPPRSAGSRYAASLTCPPLPPSCVSSSTATTTSRNLLPTLSIKSSSLLGIVVDASDNTIVYAPPTYTALTGINWITTIGLRLDEVRSRILTPLSNSTTITTNQAHAPPPSITPKLLSPSPFDRKRSSSTLLPDLCHPRGQPENSWPVLLWPSPCSRPPFELTTLTPPLPVGNDAGGAKSPKLDLSEPCDDPHRTGSESMWASCWHKSLLHSPSSSASSSNAESGLSSLFVLILQPIASQPLTVVGDLADSNHGDTSRRYLGNSQKPQFLLPYSVHLIPKQPDACLLSSVEVDARFAAFLGQDQSVLVNLSLFDLIHLDDLESVSDTFKLVLSNQTSALSAMFRLRTSFGVYRWVRLLATYVAAFPQQKQQPLSDLSDSSLLLSHSASSPEDRAVELGAFQSSAAAAFHESFADPLLNDHHHRTGQASIVCWYHFASFSSVTSRKAMAGNLSQLLIAPTEATNSVCRQSVLKPPPAMRQQPTSAPTLLTFGGFSTPVAQTHNPVASVELQQDQHGGQPSIVVDACGGKPFVFHDRQSVHSTGSTISHGSSGFVDHFLSSPSCSPLSSASSTRRRSTIMTGGADSFASNIPLNYTLPSISCLERHSVSLPNSNFTSPSQYPSVPIDAPHKRFSLPSPPRHHPVDAYYQPNLAFGSSKITPLFVDDSLSRSSSPRSPNTASCDGRLIYPHTLEEEVADDPSCFFRFSHVYPYCSRCPPNVRLSKRPHATEDVADIEGCRLVESGGKHQRGADELHGQQLSNYQHQQQQSIKEEEEETDEEEC